MRRPRFVRVSYPWDATIEVSSPHPARFYVSLIAQTLEYGAPAARRHGAAWAALGRVGLPERSLAAVLRLAGVVSRPSESDDDGVHPIVAAWAELRARDSSLPAEPGELSLLRLTRASAITTFYFAESGVPLLVAKRGRGSGSGVDNEVAALLEAAGSGIAPRYLGMVDRAHLQRGVPGRAMRVVPVRARTASQLRWTPQHASAARAFVRLADMTRKDVAADAMRDRTIEAACAHPTISAETRAAVEDAHASLSRVPISVLRHGDTSPQNLLFAGDELSGLVDWADASPRGMPGADIWNTALACIDTGVGLVRLSESELVSSFTAAWFRSELGREARRAGCAAARAAGVPDELHRPLELLFFARRVGHRLRQPERFLTSAGAAAEMLERVRAAPL